MRKLMIIGAICVCSLSAGARSLNISTGSVNYLFNDATMGDAVLTGGTSLTVCGRTFNVDDITSMTVVNDDLSDNIVDIVYKSAGATVTIAGNIAKYVDATVTGAHVTIAQGSDVSDSTCGEISYQLSGESSNGSLSMSGSYKASIDLLGLTLSNPNGAALDIQNGKRIAVSAKNGTVNTLSDGENGSQKGAIVCKGHLEFKGKGSLTVSGNASHAIYAKEYVSIKNCALTIDKSVKDGINCAQYFAIESGTLAISGIGDDGIQIDYKDDTDRETEDTGSAEITGGTINIAVTADASKAIKTEGDINISGGTLTLSVSGNGIWDSSKLKTKASSCLNADADVNISGGEMTLTATGDGGKGLSCDGTLTISGGTITAKTSGGVVAYVNNKLQNNYTGNIDNLGSDYKSSPKGFKADTSVIINGGTIDLTTTGTNGEGIESKGELVINDGNITVHSYDDGINSSSHMRINGGNILVIATNNDGLDSNGNLYINGGYIRAFGATSPECGIDANEEEHYSVYFTGGTLLAVGGSNSTPSNSASTQAYVSGSLSVSGGSTVTLKSGSTTLATFDIPSEYTRSGSSSNRPGQGSSSSALITCGDLKSGGSYTLTSGSSSTNVTARLTGSSGGRP